MSSGLVSPLNRQLFKQHQSLVSLNLLDLIFQFLTDISVFHFHLFTDFFRHLVFKAPDLPLAKESPVFCLLLAYVGGLLIALWN